MDGLIGFGQNDNKVLRKTSNFKAQGGNSYHLSLAWWPGYEDGTLDFTAASPHFLAKNRVYIKGAGYVIANGSTFNEIAGNSPRTAIATIVVKWPTDKKGVLNKTALKNGDYEVLIWVMGRDKYSQLADIHAESSFGESDLKVSCTDTGFQKMTFIPKSGKNLLKTLVEGGNPIAKDILEQVKALSSEVENSIGRTMTLDQVKEKLGMEVESVTTGGVTADIGDIDDVLDDALEGL